MPRRLLSAVVALVALVAGACGDGGDGAGEADAARVVKIGVVAPLDAGLVDFGRGIRNSVQLAVDQANGRDAIPGWRIEVDAADDSSDPAKGEAAAQRLAADAAVIGVVGTYNSGVAARVAPVLAGAGIAMISPGNTDPALTLGPDAATPVRPHPTYFRMVAADNVQGPFLAHVAFDDLRARRVAVVSEAKAVSKGLADAFGAALGPEGGAVVFTRTVPDRTTSYGDVVRAIAPLRPDVVFFGGEYDVGAEFTKQVAAGGVTVPVMGGDGLKDDKYIQAAGPASDADLASSVGAPAGSLPSTQPYVDAYARAGFGEPPSDFGAYAYDAANVLIAAAAGALAGARSVTREARAATVAAVQATDTAGVTGRVAFDRFGDTRTKVLTLYRVAQGAWKPFKTETVS